MNGYAGQILRVNLTNRSYDTIDTNQYADWVGGEAMGTAIFWDEVDKDYILDTDTKTGLEPDNVIILLSGPTQGTLARCSGRTEIVGMSPIAYPRPQFSRGNMGGRFSAMMKFAGYDAIIIKGAADKPVWLNIINDKITFEDASEEGYALWGQDTYEAQLSIWRIIGQSRTGQWLSTGNGATTQVPAIALIGQAGENKVLSATVQHEEGHAVGHCGFGAVLGAKNLKAVSVLGTKGVTIARPKDLLDAKKWVISLNPGRGATSTTKIGGVDYLRQVVSCFGCGQGCVGNVDTGGRGVINSGVTCVEGYINSSQQRNRFLEFAKWGGYKEDVIQKAAPDSQWGVYEPTAVMQRYGLNAYEVGDHGPAWLKSLYMRGYLGKGKKIETDMDFSIAGKEDGNFANEYLRRVAFREEIGNDLADGAVRCAKKWGVFEEDIMNGLLPMIYWIGEVHWGCYIDWAYESLFGVRDINMHRNATVVAGNKDPKVIEKNAARFAELEAPWHNPLGIDRSESGIYSSAMAECVAWGRRFGIFYANSCMYCDWGWGANQISWWNSNTPDGNGLTPEFETRFLNSITGLDLTYEQGLEIGRKAWNLQRAIVTMHGRHRDEEYFPPFPPYDSYVYHEGEPYIQNNKYGGAPPATYATWTGTDWKEDPCRFPLDKNKMDDFKTKYYNLEGWDPNTGWPKRSTLESLGLKYVADELEKRGRIGAE